MEARKRDRTLDILKGWAIILVVLGHIDQTPEAMEIWLYSFHLPLFFLCSGLLFSAERYPHFREFFFSRVRSLVVPYFGLGLILWLLIKLWGTFLAWYYRLPELMNWDVGYMKTALFINYRLHPGYYDMWFICTLFVGELLFYPIARLTKGKWYALLPLSLFFIFLQRFVSDRVQGAWWSVDLVPACLCFLCLGYLLRQLGPRLKESAKLWQLPIALALNVLFCILSYKSGGKLDLYFSRIGNPLWVYLAACAGCWAAYIAAVWMRAMRITEFYGRNSLVVYIFHHNLLVRMGKDLVEWLSERSWFAAEPTFQWAFIFLWTMLLSALFAWAVNRWCPWLLGKRRKKRLA